MTRLRFAAAAPPVATATSRASALVPTAVIRPFELYCHARSACPLPWPERAEGRKRTERARRAERARQPHLPRERGSMRSRVFKVGSFKIVGCVAQWSGRCARVAGSARRREGALLRRERGLELLLQRGE